VDREKLRELEDLIVLQAMPGNLSAYLAQAQEDGANYVVVDTPLHAGGMTDAAIRAADLVVIPIRPGPFDINTAAGTVEIM
jgi:chromosome partitioning protein